MVSSFVAYLSWQSRCCVHHLMLLLLSFFFRTFFSCVFSAIHSFKTRKTHIRIMGSDKPKKQYRSYIHSSKSILRNINTLIIYTIVRHQCIGIALKPYLTRLFLSQAAVILAVTSLSMSYRYYLFGDMKIFKTDIGTEFTFKDFQEGLSVCVL